MTDRAERRLMHRSVPEDHGIVHARVRPGWDVCVIDLCAGGALIETIHRLLPGATIELHLATAEQHVAMRGRVLRCAVARLRASGIWYRGAIGFERHLPWLLECERRGYPVPGCDSGEGGQEPSHRAAASRAVPR